VPNSRGKHRTSARGFCRFEKKGKRKYRQEDTDVTPIGDETKFGNQRKKDTKRRRLVPEAVEGTEVGAWVRWYSTVTYRVGDDAIDKLDGS